MSSRLALLLIGLPACFQPSYPEGIACSAEGKCPSPLECEAGVCVKPGGTEADGAPVDGAPADGPLPAIDAMLGPEIDASCEGLLPFKPSNFEACVLGPVNVGLVMNVSLLSAPYRLDTDTGEIVGPDLPSRILDFVLVDQADAPDLMVIAVESLEIGPTAGLGISGSRAMALVAIGDMTVRGLVSAGAVDNLNGPGGDNPESCATGRGADGVAQAIASGAEGGSGGGGGGFADVGGTGAEVQEAPGGTPSPGGVAAGAIDLIPLRGGCAGGKGGLPTGGAGGGAGGALQLVAGGALVIESTGIVTARGGGGRGIHAEADGSGGGGGGAGGGILLEANSMRMSGAVTANGGGGGQGARSANETGDGQNGADSSSARAQGGAGIGSGGDGGAGGSGVGVAGLNGLPGDSFDTPAGGGGGGGSAGRIHLRSIASDPVIGPEAVVSPAQQ